MKNSEKEKVRNHKKNNNFKKAYENRPKPYFSEIINNDEIVKNKLFKNFVGAIAIQCNKNEYIWETNDDDIKNIIDMFVRNESKPRTQINIKIQKDFN